MNAVVLLSSVIVLVEVVLLVNGDGFSGVWRDGFLNDGNFLLFFVGVV